MTDGLWGADLVSAASHYARDTCAWCPGGGHDAERACTEREVLEQS